MIILDSYVFRHKKSILMVYFGLGVTYEVINDNLVILWCLGDPQITTDYSANMITMFTLDFYVFRHRKSILMVYFGLEATSDVIHGNNIMASLTKLCGSVAGAKSDNCLYYFKWYVFKYYFTMFLNQEINSDLRVQLWYERHIYGVVNDNDIITWCRSWDLKVTTNHITTITVFLLNLTF